MIFLDTNLASEPVRPSPNPKIVKWLDDRDAELAISTVVLAEIAYGIMRIPSEQRAMRLRRFPETLAAHYAGRVFAFDESSAFIYGGIAGAAARKGRTVAMADGMIAAIALRHSSAIATRNTRDFEGLGVDLINPWSDP